MKKKNRIQPKKNRVDYSNKRIPESYKEFYEEILLSEIEVQDWYLVTSLALSGESIQ